MFTFRQFRVSWRIRTYTARFWNARTGEPVGLPMKHPDYVWTLAFNQEGSVLATGGQSSVVHLWDTRHGLQLGAAIPQSSWINALVFRRNSDGSDELLAAGSDFLLRGIPVVAGTRRSVEQWRTWLHGRSH